MNFRQNALSKNIKLSQIAPDVEHFSPFFLSEYLKSRSTTWAYYLTSTGWLFPLLLYKKFGIGWAQLTSYPIHVEKDYSLKPSQDDYDALLELRTEIDFFLYPTANAISDFTPQGAEIMPFGTYVSDLSHSQEELFSSLHSKHRNVIRKAEKSGVTISTGAQYADDFFSLLEQTYARTNTDHVTKNEFMALVSNLGEHLSVTVAFDDAEVIQGGAVFLWSPEGCYYLYGASIERPTTGAINYLHWNQMLKMRGYGVAKYDLMGARPSPEKGSKIEGIQRFKSRFGGDFVAGNLWQTTFSPNKRKLHGLLVRARNHYRKLRG